MAYEVHLSKFDGPLDLLLHLIEKAEVDIKDIFISEITSQYLSFMDQIDELDMDTASEFLTMAATLVYIKSRTLLPRPPREEGVEEDPEVVLMRQLREYKAFKEASTKLEELLQENAGQYTKLPEEFLLPPPIVEWNGGTLEELYDAFCEILLREKTESVPHPLHEVQADVFTIRSKSHGIRDLLRDKSKVDFRDLFPEGAHKIEIVVTFMALLEMIAHGEVSVQQDTTYGNISITAKVLLSDDDEIDYMDE